MIRWISRPDPYHLPELKLPFYIRAVGYHEAEFGWSECKDGSLKNFVQIFWGISGVGEIWLNGRFVFLRPGEMLYLLPWEDHHYRVHSRNERWCYYWLKFDGPLAGEIMLSYGYGRGGFHAGECPIRLFRELELLLFHFSFDTQRRAAAVGLELLGRAGGVPEERRGVLSERFVALVHDRFSSPAVSVDQLARELGVHRTTLNAVCKRELGTAPGRYLNSIRLQHALSLLRETGYSVKELAWNSGFRNMSYFCRQIRNSTGCSPSEYRRIHMEDG